MPSLLLGYWEVRQDAIDTTEGEAADREGADRGMKYSGAGWMGTRLTESGPGELHHAEMDAEAALPP